MGPNFLEGTEVGLETRKAWPGIILQTLGAWWSPIELSHQFEIKLTYSKLNLVKIFFFNSIVLIQLSITL